MYKFYFLIMMAFLIGCADSTNSDVNDILKKTIEYWHNKEIVLPDELLLFSNGDYEVIDKQTDLETFKIFSIINSECTSCTISELMYWNDFLKNRLSNDSIVLMLIYSGESDYLVNVILEDSDINLPIILDKSGSIIENNPLFKNSLFNTILLDKDNKIHLMGRLIDNKKMEDLFLEELKKQSLE